MDPFHERLARTTLDAIAEYGFCLAGGYAVQAHGFLERRSEDVDLFTTMAAERDFPAAVQRATAALHGDRLDADVTAESPTFARLRVRDPETGHESNVELCIDWRAHPPTQLSIGPVLHADDAVANKISALYTRGEVRDYIDVDAILASGRYTGDALLALAADHDPGFDARVFAQALTAVERLPDRAFEPYDMTPAAAGGLRARMAAWAAAISTADTGR